MSTSTETRARVHRIVSQILKVPIETITDDSSPDTIERWDSLQHMNLVMAIEEGMGVQFDAEQIAEMLNVGLILIALGEKGIA